MNYEKLKLRTEIARLRALLPSASEESAVIMQARINAKFEQLYGKVKKPKVDEGKKQLPLVDDPVSEEDIEIYEAPPKKKKSKSKKPTKDEVEE